MIVENKNGHKTIFRFDPPMSWMVEPLNKDNTAPMGVYNVAHFVPCNKNHTRVIFRAYMKMYKQLRLIPFFKDISQLESWRILDEDNSLIAGQSIRTDYLGAPIAYRSRSEDGNISLIYKYYGTAIKNDNDDIWFKSWNCNNQGAICSDTGTDKAFNVNDIEDILANPIVISTPFGELSATAMTKEYPPANKSMMTYTENKLFFVKWTFIATATGLSLFGFYKFYKSKK